MAGKQELYKLSFAKIFKNTDTARNSKVLSGIAAEEVSREETQRDFTSGVINFEIYTLHGTHPITKAPVYCDIWADDDDDDDPMDEDEFQFRAAYLNHHVMDDDDDDDDLMINYYNDDDDDDDDVIIEGQYFLYDGLDIC